LPGASVKGILCSSYTKTDEVSESFMILPVLATKTYRPHIHGPLVTRERLFEKMSLGTETCVRLILVCAPAGFGKSTLVATWAETQAAPMAWLSLDEQDAIPERFFTYLIAAIQRVHPDFGADLFEQIRTGIANGHETLLSALINAFGEIPTPLLVTLDDYHVINNPIIHESLTYLLEHAPSGMTFLIATRVVPPLSLPRLRARRQLVDIRLQDLRFTTSEIIRFFNDLYALGLDLQEISTLEERTEGWAAGLQLAVLALPAESANRREFIQQFSGSQEYIADYLLEEVLNRQPTALTTFLLRTSILDRFCAPLCQALTDERESEAILQDLFSRNAFLIPLDSERRWFRYHHLLADLLYASLQRTYAPLLPELHHRACAWFESNGYTQEALTHALAGRDFRTVERLVNENWTAMLHQGNITVTLRWLSALSRMATQPNLMPEIVQSTLDWLATLPAKSFSGYPALHNTYAWALFLSGRLDKVNAHLQRSEQALAHMLSVGHLRETDIDYREISAEAKVLTVFLLYARSELDAALEQAHQALQFVQHASNLLKGSLQVILGHIYRGLNQSEQAVKAYRESIPLVWQSGNTIGTMSAYAGLISLYRSQSHFPLAEQTFQEALQLMDENQIHHIPAAGILYLERAALLFAQNMPAEASLALDLAVEVAQHSGLWDFREQCDALRAQLTPTPAPIDQSALIEPLTARELEVLALLAGGFSNNDIASKLVISLATVKKHASSILSKLDAANRTQAVARARKIGLL
jgi:LuxR family transcriptional regulator, maltose regulon positive regulatory protein